MMDIVVYGAVSYSFLEGIQWYTSAYNIISIRVGKGHLAYNAFIAKKWKMLIEIDKAIVKVLLLQSETILILYTEYGGKFPGVSEGLSMLSMNETSLLILRKSAIFFPFSFYYFTIFTREKWPGTQSIM